MPLLRHVFPCYVTPLRFKAVQNHCVPWHTPASRCIALASRHQPPHRPCVSVRGDSLLCHSIALRFISMPLPNNASPLIPSPLRFCARRLFTLHSFATLPDRTLPRLRYALLNPTLPLLFRAHRGDSFRYPAIACHCFSILRLRYAKRLPAAPLQHFVSLHFSIALPRYASPRKASAVLLVPKQNSAYPMQFLAVRRSASPLLSLPCITPPFLASHHSALPLLC